MNFKQHAPEKPVDPPHVVLAATDDGDASIKACIDCHESLCVKASVQHKTSHKDKDGKDVVSITPIDFEFDGSVMRLGQMADAYGLFDEERKSLLRALGATIAKLADI